MKKIVIMLLGSVTCLAMQEGIYQKKYDVHFMGCEKKPEKIYGQLLSLHEAYRCGKCKVSCNNNILFVTYNDLRDQKVSYTDYHGQAKLILSGFAPCIAQEPVQDASFWIQNFCSRNFIFLHNLDLPHSIEDLPRIVKEFTDSVEQELKYDKDILKDCCNRYKKVLSDLIQLARQENKSPQDLYLEKRREIIENREQYKKAFETGDIKELEKLKNKILNLDQLVKEN